MQVIRWVLEYSLRILPSRYSNTLPSSRPGGEGCRFQSTQDHPEEPMLLLSGRDLILGILFLLVRCWSNVAVGVHARPPHTLRPGRILRLASIRLRECL